MWFSGFKKGTLCVFATSLGRDFQPVTSCLQTGQWNCGYEQKETFPTWLNLTSALVEHTVLAAYVQKLVSKTTFRHVFLLGIQRFCEQARRANKANVKMPLLLVTVTTMHNIHLYRRKGSSLCSDCSAGGSCSPTRSSMFRDPFLKSWSDLKPLRLGLEKFPKWGWLREVSLPKRRKCVFFVRLETEKRGRLWLRVSSGPTAAAWRHFLVKLSTE